MNRYILIAAVLFSGCSAKFDPRAEEKAIREVLLRQEIAWNEGNIETFMDGYWQSDSLMFIGATVTHGWDSTIARYRKTYPNTDAMGRLKFTFYDFKFVSNEACLVTGKYQLKRKADEPSGMFTLLLKKIGNEWLIIYDHTS